MAKFKLKNGAKIGSLAAENDGLLKEVFVDQHLLEVLTDTSNQTAIILGRTGSGKTALLDRIKRTQSHVSVLNPEDLSMQYLHNSSLRTIQSWGVNLEPFYKYLWRHICILELVRIRYTSADAIPSKLELLFDFKKIKKREMEAKEASEKYLRTYGAEYWVSTDTRIKKITEELDSKLRADAGIAMKLGIDGQLGANAHTKSSIETEIASAVEKEVVQRTQQIVSDFLIADLNKVVELLCENGFRDEQKKYFILLDDLDKGWMPDDALYAELVKSLLFTIVDLNRRLPALKIVVAVRENIFFRVFRKAGKFEPQREKWRDNILHLSWKYNDLVQLVDNRLAAVYREKYTTKPPSMFEILPDESKRQKENPVDFVLTRTFMRPRDVIDFLNIYLEKSGYLDRVTWATLHDSEAEYSRARLQSVFDEWKDSYFGLPATFAFLKRQEKEFSVGDITEEDIMSVFGGERAGFCVWLKALSDSYIAGTLDRTKVGLEFLKALFFTGIVGMRMQSHEFRYSYEHPISISVTEDLTERSVFRVHKMFRSALGMPR